ncbi:MAG: zinc-ribbon domain-containing protein [Clostridia bacterium]|nr:zinc-ribbon domain-containing protein [Clostridia bacterium]
MFCMNCGTELKPDTIFCHNCGTKVITNMQEAPTPIEVQSTISKNSGRGFGIASLVLGIVSLALSFQGSIAPCICGILGIIFGAIGMGISKKAGVRNRCATAGLILSIIGVSVTLLVNIIYWIISILMATPSTSTNPYI